MEQDSSCEKNIYELQELKDIKRRPDILSMIRLDVTPQMVMEPRFLSRPEDLKKLREIAGYVFYVETECAPPMVMLLKLTYDDIMNTVGVINEIPVEMVERAVQNPVVPPVNGMCAITDEIKDWLKKKLGV